MTFRMLRPGIRSAIGVVAIVCSGIDWASRAEFIAGHIAWLRTVALITTPLFGNILWPLLLVLGGGLIWWDIRQRGASNTRAQIAQQAGAGEKDVRDRIVKWLASASAQQKPYVNQAFLFGSVVHDHYPLSDVDLIIEFKPVSDRRLEKLARKIKGKISEEFERTFQHKLHVTFFCSDETAQRDRFLNKAGKHSSVSF
jgi:predicted nucleotidyltransferase